MPSKRNPRLSVRRRSLHHRPATLQDLRPGQTIYLAQQLKGP